jgi:hypothetical protein
MNKDLIDSLRELILKLVLQAESLPNLSTGKQKRRFVIDNLMEKTGSSREIYVSLVDAVIDTGLFLAKNPELLISMRKKCRCSFWT